MSRIACPAATGFALLASLIATPIAAAGSLRHGESNAELTVSAVSERTVRIALTPLDEKGKPRTGPVSTALVELKLDTKLQVRELPEAKEVEVGKPAARSRPAHNHGERSSTSSPGTGRHRADGSVTFERRPPCSGWAKADCN